MALFLALALAPSLCAGCRAWGERDRDRPASPAGERASERTGTGRGRDAAARPIASGTARAPTGGYPAPGPWSWPESGAGHGVYSGPWAPATADPWPTYTPWPTATDPPTATPDPFARAGLPVLLELPAIGVSASIESVGVTDDLAMDVPKGWMNVGWFENGFRPGEIGNAVIAGHLDTNTGGPAVFWELDKVAPGDEVTISYDGGDRFTFVVQGSQLYDHDAEGPIIQQIFGPAYTANLNLITCDGAWDRGKATYTKRLVVYATIAPEKTVKAGSIGTYD